MTKHEKLVREIKDEEIKAKDLDLRVIDHICRDPLKFTAGKIRDPHDTRPIRWRYVGVFSLLKGRTKKK